MIIMPGIHLLLLCRILIPSSTYGSFDSDIMSAEYICSFTYSFMGTMIVEVCGIYGEKYQY